MINVGKQQLQEVNPDEPTTQTVATPTVQSTETRTDGTYTKNLHSKGSSNSKIKYFKSFKKFCS
jgi:hypothetical protein